MSDLTEYLIKELAKGTGEAVALSDRTKAALDDDKAEEALEWLQEQKTFVKEIENVEESVISLE